MLDDVADFMDGYNLLPHQRTIVRRYIKDLKRKKHQTVLTNILNQHQFEEKQVVQGLICSYLDFQSIVDPTLIIAKLLILTLPKNKETVYCGRLMLND